jgi:hypothetical protein
MLPQLYTHLRLVILPCCCLLFKIKNAGITELVVMCSNLMTNMDKRLNAGPNDSRLITARPTFLLTPIMSIIRPFRADDLFRFNNMCVPFTTHS